jgi:N-[(2S)-2-amino-2-carboxyethyl]-L-glutamate dehydrogenase
MTADAALLFVTGDEVTALLRGQEAAIMAAIADAYAAHGRGESLAPHSTFLRFPGGRDRMIALPAYLGGRFGVAGIKWIASFPDNPARGLERASGVVVLSSLTTGRPTAILEGSVVSAKRTAASAAVAARALHATASDPEVGLLGCGIVNFETLRFLRHVWPALRTVRLHDLSAARAARFAASGAAAFPGLRYEHVPDARALLERATLVSIATTALEPHLGYLGGGPLQTVLHLSLRDLEPAVVLASDNVVDDPDHVCRADTSLHRAQRLVGHRGFIRCALADVLARRQPPKRDYGVPTIFSPFGLGILDIAVAQLVCERAATERRGLRLPFAPTAAA